MMGPRAKWPKGVPRRRQGETPDHYARRLTYRQILDVLHYERARRTEISPLPRLEVRP